MTAVWTDDADWRYAVADTCPPYVSTWGVEVDRQVLISDTNRQSPDVNVTVTLSLTYDQFTGLVPD